MQALDSVKIGSVAKWKLLGRILLHVGLAFFAVMAECLKLQEKSRDVRFGLAPLKRSTLFRLLLVLGVLVILRLPSFTVNATTPATISGRVRCGAVSGCGALAYQDPITAAGVVLAHKTGGSGILSDEWTDLNTPLGTYSVTGMSPGIYDVYASAFAYQSTLCASGVTVLSGQTLHFDCYLDPCVSPSCLIFTITSVVCDSSTLNVGSLTTCTVTVSGPYGSVSGETVSWSDPGGGSVSLSPNTCSLSGISCSVTATGATAGSVTLNGSYPGDSNNRPSSGTFSITVNPEARTTTTTTPIPEYPIGLPLLAIMMILSYAVIERKTRKNRS